MTDESFINFCIFMSLAVNTYEPIGLPLHLLIIYLPTFLFTCDHLPSRNNLGNLCNGMTTCQD